MDAFSSKDIPPAISCELKDRLVKAGFVNETLKITPLPINHDGKRGKLMWYSDNISHGSLSMIFADPIFYYIYHRNDLKHAYLNMRPALAKSCPEWDDIEFYKNYVDSVGIESKDLKTCMNWYACYAQKPLQQ